MIDTHSHIYLPEFTEDQAAMLGRATASGVSKIYLPAIEATTHQSMLDLEAKNPELCIAMMGVHPCSVIENYNEEVGIA